MTALTDPETFVTAIAALALVLALLIGAARWIRSLDPRQGQALSVRETIALDARRRLHLIACGDRQVLLLTGGPQDQVIGWLPIVPAPDAHERLEHDPPCA